MKCLIGEGTVCPECKAGHCEVTTNKLKMIEEAQNEPDILELLAKADDPGEVFQRVLSGGHFWREVEDTEGQKRVKDFRSMLEGTIGVE
jgi:hypothetical protein